MGFNLISYNCRNLPKNQKELLLRPDINVLLEKGSIICLQEIWYSQQELKYLNNLHKDFIANGIARTDDSESISDAKGSAAIFYRK